MRVSVRHSRRKPRGAIPPSRHIDYLRSCLAGKPGRSKYPKEAALLHVAGLVHLIVRQTKRGDKQCGYFLGEMMPILEKQRPALEKANETFRKRFSSIESARFATSKESRLRQIVLRIVTDARAERRRLQRAQDFPDLLKVIKPNEQLLALPDLDNSPEAIEQWTNVAVYPRLRKMARRLAADPVIGNMKKALDENGKFQISRLKPLIRQTVARIATVPGVYYFRVT
jgi:hypothetical protein